VVVVTSLDELEAADGGTDALLADDDEDAEPPLQATSTRRIDSPIAVGEPHNRDLEPTRTSPRTHDISPIALLLLIGCSGAEHSALIFADGLYANRQFRAAPTKSRWPRTSSRAPQGANEPGDDPADRGAGGYVAAACVWLASDEAGWVTGQMIQINGGSITT
jgi:hypothetical protein